MRTASVFSQKPPVQNGIGIVSPATMKTANQPGMITAKTDFKYCKEKAIVIDMFSSEAGRESQQTKFTYTLKHGDDKRLNKNGVLRIYDLNKPLDIPVTQLLGKWKKTHVGVTFIVENKNWCIKGNMIKNPVLEQKHVTPTVFQRLMKFVLA